jgi:hypothetical protein
MLNFDVSSFDVPYWWQGQRLLSRDDGAVFIRGHSIRKLPIPLKSYRQRMTFTSPAWPRGMDNASTHNATPRYNGCTTCPRRDHSASYPQSRFGNFRSRHDRKMIERRGLKNDI